MLATYERLPGDLRGGLVVKMGGAGSAESAETRERSEVVVRMIPVGFLVAEISPFSCFWCPRLGNITILMVPFWCLFIVIGYL